MTTLLLALAHTGCFIAIAAALIRPRFRRPVAYGLLGLAAVALIGGVLGSGPRVLDVVATFPSFRDNRVVLADYAIETVTSGSFSFGGVALLFAAGWAAALLCFDRRT